MGEKETRHRKPIRVSAGDYVASLVRSPHHIADYDAFLKQEKYVRTELARGIVLPEKPEQAFLNRWPLLLKPIPPEKARLEPGKFVGHIVPSVVRSGDAPESWASGNLWDWPVIAQLPWPQARFLPFFINLGRPDEEIIADLTKILRVYRLPGAKESVQKAREMPARWKVWDTFMEKGEQNIRKTAKILFPKVFNDRAAKAEVNALAEKKYAELRKEINEKKKRGETTFVVNGRRLRIGAVLAMYETKFEKMVATPERQRERDGRIAYIKRQIEFCRNLIDIHKPLERNLYPTFHIFGEPPAHK